MYLGSLHYLPDVERSTEDRTRRMYEVSYMSTYETYQKEIWSPTYQGSRDGSLGHAVRGPNWSLQYPAQKQKEATHAVGSNDDRSRDRLVRDRFNNH